MSTSAQQILVLIALAAMLMALNIKTSSTWVKFPTFVLMLGSLAGAVLLALLWVIP